MQEVFENAFFARETFVRRCKEETVRSLNMYTFFPGLFTKETCSAPGKKLQRSKALYDWVSIKGQKGHDMCVHSLRLVNSVSVHEKCVTHHCMLCTQEKIVSMNSEEIRCVTTVEQQMIDSLEVIFSSGNWAIFW